MCEFDTDVSEKDQLIKELYETAGSLSLRAENSQMMMYKNGYIEIKNLLEKAAKYIQNTT